MAVETFTQIRIFTPEGVVHSALSLTYSSCSPHAVKAVIGKDNVWEFDRDLVRRGLYEPVGEGDVSITPAGEWTLLVLYPGITHLRTTVYLPSKQLQAFVRRAYSEVSEESAEQRCLEGVEAWIASIK